MKGYINVVYKNGNVYVCEDVVVKKIFKEGNCFFIMRNKNLDNSYYVIKNIDTKEELVIDDQDKLCDFCAQCDESTIFVCNGITGEMGLVLFCKVKQKRKELGLSNINTKIGATDTNYSKKRSIFSRLRKK